eukprot:TRINITY_DN13035_c0_g1_i2.p1 TRINITY_DN13035_c0_g1~~TRINITY_DN13035_c0_g1_i2.p1  ORF type:complete len:118 (+),score=3.51 TRINITY_DN13035_c0_g1_i2:320-673(+)
MCEECAGLCYGSSCHIGVHGPVILAFLAKFLVVFSEVRTTLCQLSAQAHACLPCPKPLAQVGKQFLHRLQSLSPRAHHPIASSHPGWWSCLLYTSDAADEEDSVDLGGRRIIKKKKT